MSGTVMKKIILSGVLILSMILLSERGVVLKSESFMMVSSVPLKIIFDKLFLIMMMKRGAKYPYFAMWVATPELMIPWEK